jgi:hypothetical protein
LIKGISRNNKGSAIPLHSGVLALVIGLFMAQPALLYLFDKEIHVQISSIMNNAKKTNCKNRILFIIAENTLQKRKTDLQQELNNRYKKFPLRVMLLLQKQMEPVAVKK